MKKRRFLLLAAVLFLLAGCGNKTGDYFNGEVVSIEEKVLTVKPVSGETNASKTVTEAEEVCVRLDGFGIELIPGELAAGDRVRVLFNESSVRKDPVTIGIAFQVYRIEEDGSFTGVSQPLAEEISDDIAVFQRPDLIMIVNEASSVTLTPGTDEYSGIYYALKESWEEALNKEGRLEFFQLTRMDTEPEGLRLICCYNNHPKTWTMYGEGEGREISGTTYTFFPFSEGYMNMAVISEDGNYLESAYIVKIGNMKKVRELVQLY